MKAIKCEMCGGTDIVKKDGFYVCSSCGTKYSVEEAKKMMVEIAGAVEVRGTVNIDRANEIAPLYKIMEEAFKTKNYQECIQYATKILEVDPSHSLAWVAKGAATAWTSTFGDIRINKMTSCFINAISCAKQEEKNGILDNVADKFVSIGSTISIWASDQFEKSPDLNFVDYLIGAFNQYEEGCLLLNQAGIYFNLSEKSQWAANSLFITGINAFDNANKDFGYSPRDDGRRTDSNYDTWLDRTSAIVKVWTQAISYDLDPIHLGMIKQAAAKLYEKKLISGSLKYVFGTYMNYYDVSQSLSKTGVEANLKTLETFNSKIDERIKFIQQEEKKRQAERNAEYWKNNQAEKELLVGQIEIFSKEMNETAKKIESLSSEIAMIKQQNRQPIREDSDLKVVNLELEKANSEMNSVGLFKFKERKMLQEKMDAINNQISALRQTMKKADNAFETEQNQKISEIKARKDSLINHKCEIEQSLASVRLELTKNR